MIELKSPEQIGRIRDISKVLVEVVNRLKREAVPGVKTIDLDNIANGIIEARGAKSAFLGYRGYPKSICTSVNEEIVHGIPKERPLEEGDLLSIDVGIEQDEFFTDAAVTIGVGRIQEASSKLIDVTKRALSKAIEQSTPGNRISDISHAIQEYTEGRGYSVIREFVGHGVGFKLHEDPQIPNFGERGMGTPLKAGMVLAIEPMVSAGRWETRILDDGWTAVTKDGSLTAHFEHTVAVTKTGPKVLTEGII